MKGFWASALASSCALSLMAHAADSSSSPSGSAPASGVAAAEASIPFANHGGIYDWRVVNDRSVLIESISHRWYKATLMSPCIDLPFAERIGFESNPDGSFDKFSAITARHQRCQLVSLVETQAPRQKTKSHRAVLEPTASVSTPAAPGAIAPGSTPAPGTIAPGSTAAPGAIAPGSTAATSPQ
jgi:hypothetical protein